MKPPLTSQSRETSPIETIPQKSALDDPTPGEFPTNLSAMKQNSSLRYNAIQSQPYLPPVISQSCQAIVARTSPIIDREIDTVDEEIDSTRLHSPARGIFVGKLSELPPPERLQLEWRQMIRPQLVKDLVTVIALLPSSLTRSDTMVEPQLCMIGASFEGHSRVTLIPTIWICCGSRLCHEAVKQAVATISYLPQFPVCVTTHALPREADFSSVVEMLRVKPGQPSDSGGGSKGSSNLDNNNDKDDFKSVRTMFSKLSLLSQLSQELDELITAFVRDLRDDLQSTKFSENAIDRMTARFPDLLRSFALRLAVNAQTSEEYRAIELIRAHRKYVNQAWSFLLSLFLSFSLSLFLSFSLSLFLCFSLSLFLSFFISLFLSFFISSFLSFFISLFLY
jgi:hypothetical protein